MLTAGSRCDARRLLGGCGRVGRSLPGRAGFAAGYKPGDPFPFPSAFAHLEDSCVLLRFFGGAAIALVNWYQLPAVSQEFYSQVQVFVRGIEASSSTTPQRVFLVFLDQ